jgi:hypothetical protein
MEVILTDLTVKAHMNLLQIPRRILQQVMFNTIVIKTTRLLK